MNEALDRIPPEAWPFLTLLGQITAVVTAIWIAISVFVWWRRSASNLTPVQAASRGKGSRPDFLEVDEKQRKERIKRGEAYDKALDQRDADAERAARKAVRDTSVMGRIARLIALGMSIFTLATMISGTIFQVSYMGRLWEQYSAGERLVLVVQKHPFAFAVGALVIVYHIVRFVSERKWKPQE